MIVACPTCGAPVEFRFDDSFVRVCGSCRAAVVRTDRGPETLGQFADLLPQASPLKLFASGTFGAETFLLVGMAQLQHGSGGLWQEWYARFAGGGSPAGSGAEGRRGSIAGGKWGWLSEAQGRYYLTFERPDVRGPAYGELTPGEQTTLGGHTYTVAELGAAAYVGARGEIPFRLTPGATYAFTDLADGQGGFATIDHGPQDLGDEDTDETVYVGHQVALADLRLTGGEEPTVAASRPAQGGKLACPSCGGSLEVRAPDRTLRIGCPYCGTLVDVAGTIIARQATKPELAIPLGRTGTFAEGELTVIGYMQRSVLLDGAWYPFSEYLLHAPALGFRWLVESDGHWSYVQPIAPGAVDVERSRYGGVHFKLFQRAPIRVDQVLGEFYWQVQVGELVDGADYIAPPAMLSSETTVTEQTWSLSTYLEPAQVRAAFGFDAQWLAPHRIGVGPNQPVKLKGIGTVIGLTALALIVVAIAAAARASDRIVHSELFVLPPISTPAPPSGDAEAPVTASNIFFSKPFQLVAGENLVVELAARPANGWVYAAVDLVNDTTGDVQTFDLAIEYYYGTEGGESWTEGSTEARQFLPPPTAGTYVLRLETLQSMPREIDVQLTVQQDVFRLRYFLYAAGLLGLPLLVLGFLRGRQNKRRWESANAIGAA